MGALLLLFFLILCSGASLILGLAASLLGLVDRTALAHLLSNPLALFGLLLVSGIILTGFFTVGRTLRRTAAPLGDLMETAGRVAEGDYSARVREYGPGELRATARSFNRMVARLEEEDIRRRNLLADVTHELRTPLTIIQGNLEGLIDGIYPRDDAHLAAILDETQVLARLVDDLRILALTESGALKLQKQAVDVEELLNETAASFQAQADASGVILETFCATNLPALELDPARIRQVLSNLVVNALRYTPTGGQVSISAYAEDNSNNVVITIKDTGEGIPPVDLPHIFDRFYKSPDSRGAGLGLAIVKGIVNAHGGEISATSQVGQGTIFKIRLETGHTQ